ncbi:TIGR03943 family putative permease subunit [Nonomuraea sp. NPDC059007]|uniref:TIGR03943 family putative permease subunit n=1 Tax=Nonomuraea sp. NPDC059007 TaxID=3346692 RepID=UPI0036B8492C
MNRTSQNLVLMLLGGVLVGISAFSTEYVNYVKPGFRPFLIAAGALIVLVALAGLIQDARGTQEAHDHHDKGPRVAWLLCLPAFFILLIAPPALGSFAASRSESAPPLPPRAPVSDLEPVRSQGQKPIDMPIGEYMFRSWDKGGKRLAGKTFRLTGFVTPSKKKDRWYVTRMHMGCCAADAYAMKVAVFGAPQPEDDSWVEVTGTWIKVKPEQIPQISATGVRPISEPEFPYE